MIFTLIRLELFKTYAKWRTYIGFITVGAVIPLIMWLMSYAGDNMMNAQTRSLQNDFFITGNLFNGWTISQFIMNSLWLHVPILISLVAGDQLSGEATAGTFRLVLIRPVSRLKFLNAKYLTTLLYTASLVICIAVLSIGFGLWLFGSGDLLSVESDGITILPEHVLWIRFLLAYTLAIWSMFVIASLSFFISSFVENAIGPIVITIVIIFISLIITNLPIDAVAAYKPYFFTTYFTVWKEAFNSTIDWSKIFYSCAMLGINNIFFYTATVIIFRRKDILS
ncbi:MAG: ABC transporter permease [Bacteroidetes bacterium]|nr:ABC transporter permease [Bacteroidota bacterium]